MDIKDKINTILLCDIAIHLCIETDIDPQLVKYAVSSGNYWVIKAEYSHLDVDEPSKEDRDFVTAVLNMYRGLSNAFRKLSDDEQKELVRDHHLKIHDGEIQLPGFDGNNECDYFSIIEAYQKIDRFPEQKQPIANTHSRTEHLYNAMLDEFKKIDAVNRSWDLSKEELASILSTAPRSF